MHTLYLLTNGSYEHTGHIALAICGMKSNDGLFMQLEVIFGTNN